MEIQKRAEFTKNILEENTPTLLQQINSYNLKLPKRKQIKSLSEYQNISSQAKLSITSPSKNSELHSNFTNRFGHSNIISNERSSNLQSQIFKKNIFSTNKESLLNFINLKKNYNVLKGFGMSNYHSAITMQKSVPSVSFSKAKRFFSNNEAKTPKDLAKKENILDEHSIPYSKNKKGTSFGLGRRILKPIHLYKKDLMIPAPNKYKIQNYLSDRNKGKTFGMSFSIHSKVYLKYMKLSEPNFPGPGYYNLEKNTKKYKKELFEINNPSKKQKPKEYFEELIIGPHYYSPKTDIIKSGRYRSVSFGNSKRNL